ncbi:hypothetical protein KC363_g7767 [Hortaea werneckii]|uniref:Uncharacterized protein n=1 Tax=Hortaea werneckii TaxID=91943 RepID=A0A3M7F590_HORWE|nr:hypothetical protein KC325_g8085 [Hortaea werneckii]KAI6987174.1 hypothetical protein KC359_g8409 [Hortaea werneckii]KAI7141291.1 hypothetical protein KC344_g8095 [Hortaea werneckii]KAI7168020.1 hypothetical protein KC360_g8308 [Hortaea werneckii]KAI7184329.1 hypothetical protein KC363_g7767 [Hortaea werneckii]
MSAKRSSPPSSASSTSSNTSAKLRSLQHEAENASDYEEPSPLKIGLHGPISNSKASRQLAKWRKTSHHHHRTTTSRRDLEDSGFATVEVNGAEAPTRESNLNRWEAHQLHQVQARHDEAGIIPAPLRNNDGKGKKKAEPFKTSDMGLFARLPGEMRNVIYRYALVSPPDPLTGQAHPVRLSGSDLICGRGPCEHGTLRGAAPGIASTCRQIRREVMGIWVRENEFGFDSVMVRNRCAGNWVKALGGQYACLLKKVRLEIQVLVRPASGGAEGQYCTKLEMVEVAVELPAGREDGRFEVSVEGEVPAKSKNEEKGLREKVDLLNDGEEGVQGQADNLAALLFSEELAELVFKCRK